MADPSCPNCRERLSCVEAGMIGVWTCVYCEGAWLQSSNARKLFGAWQGDVDETVNSHADASATACAHFTCPSCERQSMRPRHLGGNALFVCDCASAYLPKPAVAALCHELGGRSWQLGELLLAALNGWRAFRNADLATTTGLAIALLFLS